MEETIGQSATLLAPLLALIVALAVDSVEESDSIAYRVFVGGVGIAAFGPMFTVILLNILPTSDSAQSTIVPYSTISVILVMLLIIGTVLHEIRRGLDKEKTNRVLLIIFIFMSAWYIFLYYII